MLPVRRSLLITWHVVQLFFSILKTPGALSDRSKTRTWDTFAHIEKYYRTLKSFGAPSIFISEAKNLSDYPVVIAPAYQLADKELVDKWISYVKNGGNLILTCRTAQKDRYGRLPEAPFGSMITPLTGNEMNFYDLLLPEDPVLLL